jgi:hypothetical protein
VVVELPTDIDVNAGADRSWQLAVSLIAAWRGPGECGDSAVAQRLAEVAAEGGATAVEQAVAGLTALGNMLLELYADCAGSSGDSILQDAATLRCDDGPCG